MKRAEREAFEAGCRYGMKAAVREISGRIESIRARGHSASRDAQLAQLDDLLGELRRLPVPAMDDDDSELPPGKVLPRVTVRPKRTA